jgi:hypothetical protein
MRAGEATGRASMRTGRATGQAGARAGRRAGALARSGGAAVAATAGTIGVTTAAAIGAGKARTAAFVRRAAAATRRSGPRTAAGTAGAVRRGGGRATVATRQGTRRAANATRRAATHLVPDPMALPDEASDGGRSFEPEAVPEPEPVGVAADRTPDRTASEVVPVPAARPAGVPLGDGWRPTPRRRPQEGQVVPLRPRATTRLKATGELLLLVALLGLVVSSIIVAVAVAGSRVLSGL